MKKKDILALILGYLSLYPDLSNAQKYGHNVTLIVFGRSRTGITSTVKQLIGPSCPTPTDSPSSFIQEYTIPINRRGVSYLNIVDVKGMVDGRTVDHDATVLSQLKSYLLDPLKLNGSLPNSILFVSKFDDAGLETPSSSSQLIQTLRRLEILQESVYGSVKKTDIAMVATRLMSALPKDRLNPQERIQQFKNAIQNSTAFKKVQVLIGENKGSDYNLPVGNGFTLLPNMDLYPQNVIQSLIDLAEDGGDSLAVDALTSLRRIPLSITLTNYNNQDYNHQIEFNLRFLIHSIPDEKLKLERERDLESLVNLFYQAKLDKIPRTPVPRAALFQTVYAHQYPTIQSDIISLLKTFLKIEIPRFTKPLVVGNGYDYIGDRDLPTSSLFTFKNYKESGIGYKIPTYLNCSLLHNQSPDSEMKFTFFVQNTDEYLVERRKFIPISGEDELGGDEVGFNGIIKQGFNVLWDNLTRVLDSLSVVQEFRTVKCELEGDLGLTSLSEEFKEAVGDLAPFDKNSRDSVTEWKGFFTRFGTHFVVKGYGGGYFKGSVKSQRLKERLEREISQSSPNPTHFKSYFDNILNFEQGEDPSYSFYGGFEPNFHSSSELDDQLLQDMLSEWKQTLVSDPQMLTYNLTLKPINPLASLVNSEKGEQVKEALDLLLKNELKYERRSAPTTTHLSRTTTTSRLTTTTTTTTRPTTTTTTTERPITCPPTVSPTYTPDKPKDTDYSANTVGQGYHLLKELVLPKTPFNLVVENSNTNYPSRRTESQINTELLSKPCQLIRYEHFDRKLSYFRTRLLANLPEELHRRLSSSPLLLSNFIGQILPGYNVKGVHSDDICRLGIETKLKELHLSDGVSVSAEFTRVVVQLPRDVSTCEEKRKWKEFFNTFGTHFVKRAAVGYISEHNLAGLNSGDECKRSLPPNFAKCDTNRITFLRLENMIQKEIPMKATFELGYIGELVADIHISKYRKLNTAFGYLLKNDLTC